MSNKSYRFNYKPVPKSMPIKETEVLLSILRDVRRSATMEHADFDETRTGESKTEMIKSRTRAYRESWLIEPLDEIIERYEDFLDNR